jgi:hypothetical protein
LLRILDLSAQRLHLVRIALIGTTLCGCSPTYQSLYDGDVRFEHCYRVDEERQVAITEKVQCWHDWTQRYRHGQSRDRIEYARARERTLAQAMAAGQQTAPHGAAGAPPCALPQPTSAFAPPPLTMTPASAAVGGNATPTASRAAREGTAGDAGSHVDGAFGAAGETSAAPVEAPGANCAGGCGKAWSSCKQQCKGTPCRSGCDEQYRGCMRACF